MEWIHNPLNKNDSLQIVILPNIEDVGQIVNPPEVYKWWWSQISVCTGLYISDSTKAKVKYYWVSTPVFAIQGNKLANNEWMTVDGWADVVENKMYVTWNGVTDEKLVKHEMIHFLMFHNGIAAGHPVKYFDKCGVSTQQVQQSHKP